MNHVVLYSGGIGSFFAAKRVTEQYGKENTVLLFTDFTLELIGQKSIDTKRQESIGNHTG